MLGMDLGVAFFIVVRVYLCTVTREFQINFFFSSSIRYVLLTCEWCSENIVWSLVWLVPLRIKNYYSFDPNTGFQYPVVSMEKT